MRHLMISYSECPADSVEFDSSPRVSPIPGGAGAYTQGTALPHLLLPHPS